MDDPCRSITQEEATRRIDRESGRSHSDRLRLLDLPPLLRVLPLRRFSLPVSSLTKNRRCPLLPLHLALPHPFASASPLPSAISRSSPLPTSSFLPPVPLSASNDAVAVVPPASSSPCTAASVRFCFSPTIRRSKELAAAHFFFPPVPLSDSNDAVAAVLRPDLLYFRPCHHPAMPLLHSSAAVVFIHQHRPPSSFSLVSSTGSCPPQLLLIASAAASPPSLRHPQLNLAGVAACLFFFVLRRRRAFPSSLSPASSPSSSSAATSSSSPPSSPPLLLHRCRHDVGMGID